MLLTCTHTLLALSSVYDKDANTWILQGNVDGRSVGPGLGHGGLARRPRVARPRQRATKAAKEVNAKLLAEGRKNQCSFKTDSDELAAGCDKKLKNLANALVEAKKRLSVAGVTNSSSRSPATPTQVARPSTTRNCRASAPPRSSANWWRAGSPRARVLAIGMGSERPLVTPDNTPAKKAKEPPLRDPVRF